MRPTTYTPEVVALAESYLHEYEDLGQVIPTIVGLCKFIGRSKSTVYKWASEEGKEAFSDTLREIEEWQHLELLNGALKGNLNPQIAKLVLHNHGYTEKQQIDTTSSDGSGRGKLQIEVVSVKKD